KRGCTSSTIVIHREFHLQKLKPQFSPVGIHSSNFGLQGLKPQTRRRNLNTASLLTSFVPKDTHTNHPNRL
ncbi:MAG: hypothetical protein V7K64_33455, partial [Nostoc sp.]|uniref:hypothetical protein n=1 Tax=Nostoc sp. TaxID=1180 RepID=UPI002FF72B9F